MKTHEGSEGFQDMQKIEACLQFITGLTKRIDRYTFEIFKKFLRALIEAEDYEEMLWLLENNPWEWAS